MHAVCMHNKSIFEGLMLVKTNPPSVKAGYGPACGHQRRHRCFLTPAGGSLDNNHGMTIAEFSNDFISFTGSVT